MNDRKMLCTPTAILIAAIDVYTQRHTLSTISRALHLMDVNAMSLTMRLLPIFHFFTRSRGRSACGFTRARKQ